MRTKEAILDDALAMMNQTAAEAKVHIEDYAGGKDIYYIEDVVDMALDAWAKEFGAFCLKWVNQPNFDIPSLYEVFQQETSSFK